MRKSLLMAGLLAATLTGTGGIAYAQQSPGSPPGTPPGPGNPPAAPPGGQNGGPPGGGQMMVGPMGPGMHHPPHGMMNPMMMGGPAAGREMEENMMMHMHPPKGAVFMFRDGDQRVLIKCADDEPTKACVDGATTLIDKLGGMPESGSQGTQDQGNQGPGNQGPGNQNQGNQNQ